MEAPLDNGINEAPRRSIPVSLRGTSTLLFLFLFLMLFVLKISADTFAAQLALELIYTILFLGALMATSEEKHVPMFFAFLPMAGFAVVPRSFGISLLFVGLVCSLVLRSMRGRLVSFAEMGESNVAPLIKMYLLWFGGWGFLALFGVHFINSLYYILLLFYLPTIAIVLYLAREQGIGPDDLWLGIKTALWIGIIVTLIQLFVGIDYSLEQYRNVNVTENVGLRYPGPFNDAIGFGQFLSVLLVFWAIYRPSKVDLSGTIAGFLGLFILMINGTRTAPIAALLGVILALFIQPGRTRKVFLRILTLGVLALVATLFIDVEKLNLFRRLFFFQLDAEGRFAIWLRSISVFLAYPWAGIGFENFSEVILKFDPLAVWHEQGGATAFTNPESTYLKVLTETGIIGTCVIVAVVLRTLKEYFVALRNRSLDHQTHSFIAASFASYVCLLVSESTVYTLRDPRILFLFGLATAIPFLYGRLRTS